MVSREEKFRRKALAGTYSKDAPKRKPRGSFKDLFVYEDIIAEERAKEEEKQRLEAQKQAEEEQRRVLEEQRQALEQQKKDFEAQREQQQREMQSQRQQQAKDAERQRQELLKSRLKFSQEQRQATGSKRPLQQLARTEQDLATQRVQGAVQPVRKGPSRFQQFFSRAGSRIGSSLTKERSMPSFKLPLTPSSTSAVKSEHGSENLLKVMSILVIILGMVVYLLRITSTGVSTLPFILSLVIFVLAGYGIAQKVDVDRVLILMPMLAFAIWYFYFQGSFDPGFLAVFLPIMIGLLTLPLLITKGQSFSAEAYGFLPVLFLFLDIGLIPWLIENFQLSITPLMQALVLYMPWWVLFGVYLLPTPESTFGAFTVSIVKVLGMLYIILILIIPAVPNLGYGDSLSTPEAGELEQAQANIREQLPKSENPFVSNLYCIFVKGEYSNVQGCVEQRKIDTEIEYTCKEIKGYQTAEDINNCTTEERKKRQEEALQAKGTVDASITKPTSVKIVPQKESFPVVSYENANLPFPFELQIENPRKQKINLVVFCNFEKQEVQEKEVFEGTIGGMESDGLSFADESYSNQFLCYPPADKKLKGTYRMQFGANMKGMVTSSRLQRAFVGDISIEAKKKLQSEEISKVIRIKEAQVPREFAGIYFDLGHAAGDPVIENKKYENNNYRPIFIRSNVQNIGGGKILKVNSYSIDLPGFSVDENHAVPGIGCLEGSVENTELYPRDIPLAVCQVTDYPVELKNPEGYLAWIPKEFEATLNYDYQVIARESVTIKSAQPVAVEASQ
ncbi:hypothetical protein HYX12_04350 [Candidatus Woesearchaeota archaeon]|nr:hypothetical protein [Candidatus Woesearchaeota archaeon]